MKPEIPPTPRSPEDLSDLDIDLDRASFGISVLTDLVGCLQRVLGKDESAAFLDAIGQRTGERLHEEYLEALGVDSLDLSQLAAVLVDLKRRLGASFQVVEVSEERLVLTNGHCPFGRAVRGRPPLCRMTSNVLGTIVADSTGFARVELDQTLADGHDQCRVVIGLRPGARENGADHHRVREYVCADVTTSGEPR